MLDVVAHSPVDFFATPRVLSRQSSADDRVLHAEYVRPRWWPPGGSADQGHVPRRSELKVGWCVMRWEGLCETSGVHGTNLERGIKSIEALQNSPNIEKKTSAT